MYSISKLALTVPYPKNIISKHKNALNEISHFGVLWQHFLQEINFLRNF